MNFGVLQVDGTSRVTGFQEKPAVPYPLASNPSSALVSMGVYVFNKSILFSAFDALCGSGQGFDFGHDIIPALMRSVRTYAFDFRDRTQNVPRYWRDIGTIDAYYAASMEVVQLDSPFHANCICSSQSMGHRSSKSGTATCQNVSRIGAKAQVGQSVISPGVKVERNATVYDSVLMPGVRVGAGARLRRVIVEEDVQIPAGFCAGFNEEHDRNRHSVSEKGVVVIDHDPSSVRRIWARRNLAGNDCISASERSLAIEQS